MNQRIAKKKVYVTGLLMVKVLINEFGKRLHNTNELCREQRKYQSSKIDSVIYRCSKQDGMAERLMLNKRY